MESAEFKDWEVVKYCFGNFLIHKVCGSCVHFHSKEKIWKCSCTFCKKVVVPKEVALFAELCYCEKW